MKKSLLFLLISVIALFSACTKTIEPNSSEANKLVNEFVYDGMSLYYLWESEMSNKKPDTKNPMDYFASLLSATDKTHGWSFITDDAEGLLAEFGGTPVDFGYELAFGYTDATKTAIFAVVQLVYPNTPAAEAGLRRSDIITKINGNALTLDNYMQTLGSEKITISYYRNENPENELAASLTPKVIETNPVYYTHIYEHNGKKTGYIFYTSFIANYNSFLYQAFTEFKNAGISDLIVDLRYNRGGSVSAAVYLASLIAPKNAVQNKSIYTYLNFNKALNEHYGSERSYQLGTYESKYQDPIGANLNLNKVYIIATGGSYSASELTIFCLDSYMDVVHIGEKTGGKYTASFSLHPYSENMGIPVWKAASVKKYEKTILKNWLIQPIVAIYTNKDEQTFEQSDGLIPEYNFEKGEGYGNVNNWKPIGDESDIFLAQAFWLIDGNAGLKPSPVQSVKAHQSTNIALPYSAKSRDNSLILDVKPSELK